MLNSITNIQHGGPYRCLAERNDNFGPIESESKEISINLIHFGEFNPSIEWHTESFNDMILVDEGQPIKVVIGFTIHRENRFEERQSSPLLEFVPLNNASNAFEVDVKKDPTEPNRFTGSYHIQQADPSQMGDYEIRIRENGFVFEQVEHLAIYVRSLPQLSFLRQNPSEFYHLGDEIDIGCHVRSYPINQTSIEVHFLNCTQTGECRFDTNTADAISSDFEKIFEKRAYDGIGVLGAKNDSGWPSVSLLENNVYSETVSIQASVASHSGFLSCQACRKKYECSKTFTPIFITDLPNKNGK